MYNISCPSPVPRVGQSFHFQLEPGKSHSLVPLSSVSVRLPPRRFAPFRFPLLRDALFTDYMHEFSQ